MENNRKIIVIQANSPAGEDGRSFWLFSRNQLELVLKEIDPASVTSADPCCEATIAWQGEILPVVRLEKYFALPEGSRLVSGKTSHPERGSTGGAGGTAVEDCHTGFCRNEDGVAEFCREIACPGFPEDERRMTFSGRTAWRAGRSWSYRILAGSLHGQQGGVDVAGAEQ